MTMTANKKSGLSANQRPNRSGRIAVLLVGGMLSGALFTIAVAALSFVRSRGIERTPPAILVEEKDRVISTQGIVLPLSVRDDGSGLERVAVWVQQNGKVRQIVRENLRQEKVFQRPIEFSPAELELEPGSVSLIVEASDASIWRNKTQKLLQLSIDNNPPRIDIFARSESVTVGEIGVAAYRITENALRSSGVELRYTKDREELFTAIAARDVDPALNSVGVFVSFFSPSEACPAATSVVATDEGSNVSRVAFSPECRLAGAGKELEQSVSVSEVIRKAEALTAGSGPWAEALRGQVEKAKAAGAKKERASVAAIARFILDTARASDYEEIVKVARPLTTGTRYWRGAARFGVFSPHVNYNDTISFVDSLGHLAKFRPHGVEMTPAQPGFSVVFSPYRGTVRLSKRLGVLGEVVVIDHGAGLSSVFYSLEGRYVEAGLQVDEGQQVGRIGDSGFHFSKALRMQFLIDGKPIDPGVLTDLQRFYANVELPLNSLRSKIGVSVARSPKSSLP
jgi:murein DD-endopeptidase MepM/ murein hydrolase activator NlpD